MKCPVIEAINEIRGAGINDDSGLVKVGGIDFVCDNVSFYMSLRIMDLARFKLSKPTLDDCIKKANKFFIDTVDKSAEEIYNNIILNCDQFAKQIKSCIKIIDEFEKNLIKALETNTNINIAVTDLNIITDTKLLTLRPDALYSSVNGIVDYVNSINVDDISISAGEKISIEHIEPFNAVQPGWAETIQGPSGETPYDYLNDMKRVLDEEMEIAKYAKRVEEYHVLAIKKISEICEKINTIISNLSI